MPDNKRFLLTLTLTSLLWLSTAGAEDKKTSPEPPAQPQTAGALPDPVAVVNGKPISKGAFEAYARMRQAPANQLTVPAVREALTNELVSQELLVQQAEKQKLDQDPEILLELDMARRNVLVGNLLNRVVREQEPSEDDIRKAYQAAIKEMSNKEYKARHILVDAEDKARAVLEKLKGGGDFAELAKTSSTDSSSAEGGDLGWFTLDMMAPPFSEAVAKLEKGKFTPQPVQTEFGWHVILLEDIRDTEPPSLEQLQPQLAQQAQRKVVTDYLAKLRSEAKIDIK